MATILIVDDEQPVREMLRDLLEGAGHHVLEAADGEEGLAACRARLPDAVITDILMPRKGGLVFLADLTREYPRARVLAISGGGKDGRLNFLATARTFPGVRTLRKPFERGDLLGTLGDLLRGDP